MRKILHILILLISTASFSQIDNSDNVKAEYFIDNFRNNLDSIVRLKNDCQLSFSSDSVFKGVFFTTSFGKDLNIDLRYKDNFRGYAELGIDFENYVVIKHRGDGSGNPEESQLIEKESGNQKWIGNYPFYIDNENEIIIYQTYISNDSFFAIQNFESGEIEHYLTPETNCICCGCWELIEFDKQYFKIKYLDTKDNMTELTIKRK